MKTEFGDFLGPLRILILNSLMAGQTGQVIFGGSRQFRSYDSVCSLFIRFFRFRVMGIMTADTVLIFFKVINFLLAVNTFVKVILNIFMAGET